MYSYVATRSRLQSSLQWTRCACRDAAPPLMAALELVDFEAFSCFCCSLFHLFHVGKTFL